MLSYDCQRFALIVVFQSNLDSNHSIHPSIIQPSIHLSVHHPSIHPFLEARHYHRRWWAARKKMNKTFCPENFNFSELCMVAIEN